jgi:hypothetical protein
MTASRGRLAWLLAGVVATVVAIATAGSTLWYTTAYRQNVHTQEQAASYPGRPGLVTVQLTDGDITITSGPPGRVEVSRQLAWAGAKPVIDEQWNGHALTVDQNCPTGFAEICSVDYTIAVPPGVALNLETDSGDIAARRSSAPQVQASSDSGDVMLSFAAAPASVYASSDSGNVTIRVPRGDSYAVHPRADTGSSYVGFGQNPASSRSITAISDAGNITVVYN